MKHDDFHVLDTTLRDGAQLRPSLARKGDASGPGEGTAPSPEGASCTLTVTLRPSRGALGRIAASLSSTPVTALSYAVSDAAQATAEIRVAQADAARARLRLQRMVDVVSVSES
jgi:hypothetical protein